MLSLAARLDVLRARAVFVDAPAGVFVSTKRYPLSQFTLDDKHQAAAAKLAELYGMTVDADAQRLASELGARLPRLELTELLQARHGRASPPTAVVTLAASCRTFWMRSVVRSAPG